MSVKLPDARAKSGAVNAALRGLEGYEVQDAPFMGSPPPPRFPEGATPGSEQPTLQPMFPDDAEARFAPESLTLTLTLALTLILTLTLTLTLSPDPDLGAPTSSTRSGTSRVSPRCCGSTRAVCHARAQTPD